jgi:hypothetical protein
LSDKLPEYYQYIISHRLSSEELRHQTESKVLKFKLELMECLGSSPEDIAKKGDLSNEVLDMSKGMVLLKFQDQYAWRVVLDWSEDWDEWSEYSLFTRRQDIIEIKFMS